MQIVKAEVTPVVLKLQRPVKMAHLPEIENVTVVFLRLETQKGQSAWGCAVAHKHLTGDEPETVVQACQRGIDLVTSLHPINIEYSLSELHPLMSETPAALCAFDLAFHDLLGLATGMPLYRLLGGFSNRIQTSVTIPLSSVRESVDLACARAGLGFRTLKIKGGVNPEEDVRRVQAINRALPGITIRLDADGGYSIEEALNVARALEGKIDLMEQPTPPDDLEGLRQVTQNSRVPILADQSVADPRTALEIAALRATDGISVKVATCGGLLPARQVEAIARAAQISLMVSCVIEPALLIAAGLSFALSSPNVKFGDLDGNLELVNDPTIPGFQVNEGWLIASERPGLGCNVELG